MGASNSEFAAGHQKGEVEQPSVAPVFKPSGIIPGVSEAPAGQAPKIPDVSENEDVGMTPFRSKAEALKAGVVIEDRTPGTPTPPKSTRPKRNKILSTIREETGSNLIEVKDKFPILNSIHKQMIEAGNNVFSRNQDIPNIGKLSSLLEEAKGHIGAGLNEYNALPGQHRTSHANAHAHYAGQALNRAASLLKDMGHSGDFYHVHNSPIGEVKVSVNDGSLTDLTHVDDANIPKELRKSDADFGDLPGSVQIGERKVPLSPRARLRIAVAIEKGKSKNLRGQGTKPTGKELRDLNRRIKPLQKGQQPTSGPVSNPKSKEPVPTSVGSPATAPSGVRPYGGSEEAIPAPGTIDTPVYDVVKKQLTTANRKAKAASKKLADLEEERKTIDPKDAKAMNRWHRTRKRHQQAYDTAQDVIRKLSGKGGTAIDIDVENAVGNRNKLEGN